jgi:cytochrome o ubiquinol oxidase subunit 1
MRFLGKLGPDVIPHDPIVLVTVAMMILGGIAVVAGITYFKKWGYLWNEWFTSVDHKKIGIMYIIVSVIMLLRGFADAIMMRLQLSSLKAVVKVIYIQNTTIRSSPHTV